MIWQTTSKIKTVEIRTMVGDFPIHVMCHGGEIPARCLCVVPHGRDIVTEVLSGGSRISRRWGRQLSREGRQHTILPNFPKNCMKLKESGPPGGACDPRAPLDPPLVFSLLSVSYWWLVRVNLVIAFGFLPQNVGR